MNQEIAYWVANRDGKILPMVTDGSFGGVDGEVTGDAVPDALRGVFSEEPRWVDVRWARDDDRLDLIDPRFADAIADIASTIRGIPKDELASEEVRQHRRTVRMARSAGIAVTMFTAVAVVAGVFALGQRNEARDSATLAEQEATRAKQEADWPTLSQIKRLQRGEKPGQRRARHSERKSGPTGRCGIAYRRMTPPS